jgi:excisionase family DNA binding protein
VKRKKASKLFKVLVVGEEPEVGNAFQKALGEVVTTAQNSNEAVERVGEAPYNLVFLDIRQPDLDGVKTFEAIKERSANSVVVMMSGEAADEEIKMAQAVGAQRAGLQPPGALNEIMTIQEVAQYLSLHELTVRRLAREGELPAFKIGRQWRVKKEILDRWIERQTSRNIGEGGGENA